MFLHVYAQKINKRDVCTNAQKKTTNRYMKRLKNYALNIILIIV